MNKLNYTYTLRYTLHLWPLLLNDVGTHEAQ